MSEHVKPPDTWEDLAEAYAHAEAEEVRGRINEVEPGWWGEHGAAGAYRRKVMAATSEWIADEISAAKAEELDCWIRAARAFGVARDLEAGMMARLSQLREGNRLYAEPEGPKLLTEEEHAAEIAAAKAEALREAADALDEGGYVADSLGHLAWEFEAADVLRARADQE